MIPYNLQVATPTPLPTPNTDAEVNANNTLRNRRPYYANDRSYCTQQYDDRKFGIG